MAEAAEALLTSAAARPGLVDPGTPSGEPFRTIRLALRLRSDALDAKGACILFTSPEPQTGKSTLAANYGLIASLTHDNVLLIDGDLRRPRLHEMFDVPRSNGLVDLLSSNAKVQDVAKRVHGLGQLSVLTAGQPIPNPGDLMSSARVTEVLDDARSAYDTIVIDSPPILAAPDAEAIASRPGVHVVLVLRKGTRRRVVRDAVRRLELVDARLAGIVINRSGRLRHYG